MMTIHNGVKVFSESPITGVVDTAAPEWLLDEIDAHGIDIGFEEHCKECTKERHDDCYDSGDGTTHLLGYKKDAKGDYVPDLDAEFSAIVNGNENITQITHSKWVSRVILCSPCYPGQGDLDNSGEYLAYTLPPGIWGNHDHLQISELSETLESIRELYTALYNIDHPPENFAIEFFYMVGELLNGKKLNELSPAEPAAGALRMMLEYKNRIPDESKKSKGV